MAEAAFRLPEQLNITNGNVSENFRKWKRQLEIYLAASGATEKDNAKQVAILLHCAGPNVVELFDQFIWETEDDKKDPEKVLDKLENYCNPLANEVIESHRFWTTPWQEPFDIFLTELRNRAERCNFGTLKNRLIRDKIIFTSQGKLQLQLLKDDKDTLENTIKLCRAHEQSTNHAKELSEGTGNTSQKVNKLSTSTGKAYRKTQTEPRSNHRAYGKTSNTTGTSYASNTTINGKHRAQFKRNEGRNEPECDFCGGKHEPNKYKCPAYGKTCKACKGRHHFQKKCRKIHCVEEESQDSDTNSEIDNFKWLSAVKSKHKQNVSACLIVNGQEVNFQVDSAADVNTINQKYVRKEQVSPTTVTLKMWNKTDLKPLGEVNLEVTNKKTGENYLVSFVVVPNGLMCLLGLQTIQEMGLVTIDSSKVIAAVNMELLGDLGEASLKVNPEIPAKTLPSRKIPLAIQDDVKRELDTLVKRGVLIPVTEPTTWVSQMAVVQKSQW